MQSSDSQLPVQLTILRTAQLNGPTIDLVQYQDGRLGILNNGAIASDKTWTMRELDECLDAFSQLTQSNRSFITS